MLLHVLKSITLAMKYAIRQQVSLIIHERINLQKVCSDLKLKIFRHDYKMVCKLCRCLYQISALTRMCIHSLKQIKFQIVYSAVEHNCLLFRNCCIFQSFMTIFKPINTLF